MSSGTVTILIPTYKRPEKLKRAVESVLQQSYSDIKIIISDNASGDETEKVASDFKAKDKRVSYCRHTENIGMNGNFNSMLTKVSTPFFCILTDDDYYLPDFIENTMQGFNNYPQAYFSILAVPEVTEQGEQIQNKLETWPREGLYLASDEQAIKLSACGYHPIITGIIFKSQLLPGFRFEPEAGVWSDFALLITLIAKYPFVISKRIGLYFIKHSSNIGASKMSILTKYSIWKAVNRIIFKDEAIPRGTKDLIFKGKNIINPERNLFVFLSKGIAIKDKEFSSMIINEINSYESSKLKILANIIYYISKIVLINKIQAVIFLKILKKYFSFQN